MAASLNNQVALITGASRGLGRAIALRLAASGASLILCARHRAELEDVADAARAISGQSIVIAPLDVTDAAQIDQVVETVLAQFGRIDILINNAGLSWYKPLTEWSRDEILTVVNVNLTGLMLMTHAVVSHMIQQQAGQIVNIASDIGRRVVPNMAPYVAAKHGVVGFSGSLLREVKAHGVKVSVVLPGIIDTYFGGGEAGTRDETWALRPEAVAETIHTVLTQPPHVVLDEVTVHPLQQDF